MKFSNDRHKAKRGGTAKWLLMACRGCEQKLFVYQKDGTGQLLRMYLDRIYSVPSGGRPFKDTTAASVKGFACSKCGLQIGSPMIYGKNGENRVAQRIIPPGPVICRLSDTELRLLILDCSKTVTM